VAIIIIIIIMLVDSVNQGKDSKKKNLVHPAASPVTITVTAA